MITSSYAFHAASTQTRALGPISHIVMICTLNRDHSSVNKKVLNIEGLALLVSSPNIIIRSLSLSLSLSYLTSEDDNTIYLSLSTVEKMYRSIDLSIYQYVCVSISPSWSNNDSVESFLSGWTEWDGCIGRHSFCSLTNANECVCYQNILLFFFTLFTLHFFYLIIDNEYKSLVLTILSGCLPYSNDWNILECEYAYDTYGSYFASNPHTHIHTFIHTYMHGYIHTYIHTYIHMHTCLRWAFSSTSNPHTIPLIPLLLLLLLLLLYL